MFLPQFLRRFLVSNNTMSMISKFNKCETYQKKKKKTNSLTIERRVSR